MITFQPTGDIPRRKPVTPEGGYIRLSHAAAGLALTLIVTAFCLRAPFTCVGPLADVIQTDLGVSSGTMGSVTTIPLLMFAAFSVVMGDLGRRYRAGYVMVLGLSMVLVGVICRSLLGTYGLFLGTAVMGIGITAGNVLIPAFIKAHFPERIGRLTGIYTAMMSLMSAVAGAVSVPLGDALGWQGSLMVWGVLIAVGLWGVFWLGDKVSAWLFDFARPQVDTIYNMKEGESPWLLTLLMLFLIGPAEEIFWRRYVQQQLSERWGANAGFAVATAIYALVHAGSCNFMLVMAALTAGGVWGGLYRLFPRLFPAILVSHALWDAAVFIWFPI